MATINLDFHFRRLLVDGQWLSDARLSCRDGVVAAIAADVPPEPSDIRLGTGLPGMPNLHSHAFQRGMAGLAEVRGPAGDSFWTWREIMYRFVGRIDPGQLSIIAALAYMEMLESGFTRVGEFHYLHHDRDGRPYANPAETSAAIAAAAAFSGIGLTHLPVFYAHAGFGGMLPEAHQARFIHDLDGFARLLGAAGDALRPLPDAVLGLAPHSLRAVTPGELAGLEALAGNAPVHIHIAEQVKEVEDCLAWSGARPVEWLLDHVDVGPRWCLVHATHMVEAETGALARSGAVAGLCPVTEANLGDGIFPGAAFAEAGGAFGVGSDSNVLIDMAEELRLLEYGQRLAARSRNVMAEEAGRSTGGDLYRAALTGGGRALGVPAALAVGSAADFITLDLDHASLVAAEGDRLLDALLFAAGRSAIDGVWRRGQQLVAGGRHRDREAIVRRYRQSLETLLA